MDPIVTAQVEEADALDAEPSCGRVGVVTGTTALDAEAVVVGLTVSKEAAVAADPLADTAYAGVEAGGDGSELLL
jgi:hypothetical protein